MPGRYLGIYEVRLRLFDDRLKRRFLTPRLRPEVVVGKHCAISRFGGCLGRSRRILSVRSLLKASQGFSRLHVTSERFQWGGLSPSERLNLAVRCQIRWQGSKVTRTQSVVEVNTSC